MKIAILSGKGGTGKTTVATNFAKALVESGYKVHLVDLDVEEPNDHLFFDVKILETEDVNIRIPVVDERKCILCGECSRVCQFGAIVTFSDKVRVFENLCHGCGACKIICPTKAIEEKPRKIGEIRTGNTLDGKMDFTMGIIELGERSGVPIIRKIKQKLSDERYDVMIFDSSPGTSCTVVESIRNVDFAILVTEPTTFGLHDLKLAYELVMEMNIPSGIVVNKSELENDIIKKFATENDIPVLMRIPFEKSIAKLYSTGKLFIDEMKGWVEKFKGMLFKIEEMKG